MKTALALIGAAVLGYLAITVRSALNLVTPKRAYKPEGYRPPEIPFERVNFQNRAGLRLAGWTAIREQAKGAVILCHGAWTNHREMESRAEALWRRGFSVMTFDFRGCGESEGRYTSLGLREADDLVAAVDYLAAGGDPGPVGVVGNSMGGAAAILAAARDERIKAVVTDGAFAAAGRDFVGYAFRGVSGLSPTLFQDAVVVLSEWVSGVRLDRIRPVASIGLISPRPVMLIHGTDDGLIRVGEAHALYAAAGEPKTLWIVPDCRHVQSFHLHPEEYVRRVAELLTEAFSAPHQ